MILACIAATVITTALVLASRGSKAAIWRTLPGAMEPLAGGQTLAQCVANTEAWISADAELSAAWTDGPEDAASMPAALKSSSVLVGSGELHVSPMHKPGTAYTASERAVFGVAMGSTTRGASVPRAQDVLSLPLLEVIANTFALTASDSWRYRVVVGYDDDDVVYGSRARAALLGVAWQRVLGCARPDLHTTLAFVQASARGQPSTAHNDAVVAAVRAGALVVLRTNDDSGLGTAGWADIAARALLAHTPPMSGAVGPMPAADVDEPLKMSILTHEYVSALHVQAMSGRHYPEVLTAWHSDDWVTLVYAALGRMRAVPGDVVLHTMGWGTRYKVRPDSCEDMQAAIVQYLPTLLDRLHTQLASERLREVVFTQEALAASQFTTAAAPQPNSGVVLVPLPTSMPSDVWQPALRKFFASMSVVLPSWSVRVLVGSGPQLEQVSSALRQWGLSSSAPGQQAYPALRKAASIQEIALGGVTTPAGIPVSTLRVSVHRVWGGLSSCAWGAAHTRQALLADVKAGLAPPTIAVRDVRHAWSFREAAALSTWQLQTASVAKFSDHPWIHDSAPHTLTLRGVEALGVLAKAGGGIESSQRALKSLRSYSPAADWLPLGCSGGEYEQFSQVLGAAMARLPTLVFQAVAPCHAASMEPFPLQRMTTEYVGSLWGTDGQLLQHEQAAKELVSPELTCAYC